MGLLDILILFFIIVFGLKNGYLLFIRKPHDNLTKLGRSINKMLFWGAIMVILGFLGTFIGMQVVIESFMRAGENADVTVFLAGIYILLKLVIFSLTSFTIISKQVSRPN